MPRALLTLSVLPESYAICRLDAGAPIPSWGLNAPFWSAIRTKDELSMVCLDTDVPEGASREGGWRILKCEGPLDF